MDIYQRLECAVVANEPFPHLVLETALDPDWCAKLVRGLPPLSLVTRGAPPGNNKRFTLGHRELLASPGVSEAWRETIHQGMSQTFLDRVLAHFGPHVRRELPDFETRFGPLDEIRAAPRTDAGRPFSSMGLEAQLAVNTPALVSGTTVKVPHVDWFAKLFVGLLYLRLPEDDSIGGDLELYRVTDGRAVYDGERQLPCEAVSTARAVPYRSNTLVLFLNTPRSVHGVTPRGATDCPRWFINLVGEMSVPLFGLPIPADAPAERSRWRRLSSWIGR